MTAAARAVRLEMPHRGGHVVVELLDDQRGGFRLTYQGRTFTIHACATHRRNGERTDEEAEGLQHRSHAFVNLLSRGPTRRLRPKPRGSGMGAIYDPFDAAAHRTDEWILDVGSSVDGVTYNTHLIATEKVRLELDLRNMIAWFFEESDFDDG